jgi:predicted permease
MLAWVGVTVLHRIGHDALPRLDHVGFEPSVLLFAVVLTMATAIACGVTPALRLARSDPSHGLVEHSRSSTATRRQSRLRAGLAAAQLALALALVAGASVLSVSFYNLMRVDLGFSVDGVLTFDINLPSVRYDANRRAAFQEQLAQRLAAIPGVTAAGGTSSLPATGAFASPPMGIETGPLAGTSLKEQDQPEHRVVSGEFFEAFAIPLLAGRVFDGRDDANAPMRAVVSANLARTAFPGLPLDRVVGQRIRVINRRGSREIIGVVGDVTLDVYGTASAAVYSAHRQFASNRNWALTQVVATDGLPERIASEVRSVVASMGERFALVVIAAFAAVSLALAAIGLYGVLAYAVRQRTREIAIRIALGATTAQIRRMVLRQATFVLGAGLLPGMAGALMLGRWLRSLTFGISPSDPGILVAAVVLLTITGVLAAWLPARRAARVAPQIAIQDA